MAGSASWAPAATEAASAPAMTAASRMARILSPASAPDSTPGKMLWQHRMNALVAVDKLRHAHIDREAGEHIGVLARQTHALADQVDHRTQRVLRGIVEIFVERHRDVVRRRLGARQLEAQIL